MIDNFGAHHLSNRPEMFEPMRSNTFTFLVPNLNNILRVGYEDTATEADARISNASEMLELSVVKASVPFFTQDVIKIQRGNSVMKVAGLPDYREGEIVVRDFIGADGKSILMAWQNKSYNSKKQTIGYMRDYKYDCYLNEYDVNYKLVRQWKLHGCWIAGLSQSEFDQTNGSERDITASISYDWSEMSLDDTISY